MPVNQIKISLVFILTLIITFNISAQFNSNLHKVQNLNVDSFDNGIEVYYSNQYKNRAIKLSGLLKKAGNYFSKKFNIHSNLKLALLNKADWQSITKKYPYGLPWVSSSGNSALVFLPADNSDGAVINIYKKLAPGENTVAGLSKINYTYKQASREMIDVIGFHELGHSCERIFGINRVPKWFDEFMATYFAYSFLKNNDEKLTEIFTTMAGYITHKVKPKYTSLDDFDRLYVNVGIENYTWYESHFLEKTIEIYNHSGEKFLFNLRDILSKMNKDSYSTSDLINALNKISPGFSGLE